MENAPSSDSLSFGQHFDKPWIKKLTGGHSVIHWDCEAACKPGENFVSKVTRYFLSYETDGQERTVTLIEKTLHSENSIPSRIMDCRAMFQNEITAYLAILPRMGMENLTAECYFVNSARPLLVLQDLKACDFRMADSRTGLGYAESALALQAVAYLHSRSFRLKATANDFPATCGKLRETVFNEQFRTLNKIWENAFWTGLESLRTSQNAKLVRAAQYLSTFSGRVIATLSQLSKSHDEFQVICHGDLWSNNLLFRYDKASEPLEVRLIDLQAMRPASCALDILHLLCTSTRPNGLGENFQTWINLYYSTVRQELSAQSIPMPFTQAQLDKELKQKTVFGLILGFMMIPCATSDPSVDTDIAADNQLDTNERRREGFTKLGQDCHSRIRQLVLDLLSLGLLEPTSAD